MQRTRDQAGRRHAGFTLVELVTVIAILGILVTLTVGAIQGVQNSVARASTTQMFRGLEAALNAFYADWNMYPWHTETDVTISGAKIHMGAPVATVGVIKPPTSITDANQKAQYALYGGLNLARRAKKPYFTSGNIQAVPVPLAGGSSFQAYADGWGRPIRYDLPETPHTLPKLTSLGIKGLDAQTEADFITNYEN